MGEVADAVGEGLGFVGDVLTQPIEWAGAGVKEVGDFAGINEISGAGQWLQDVQRSDITRGLAGTAATAYLASPYLGNMAVPSDFAGITGSSAGASQLLDPFYMSAVGGATSTATPWYSSPYALAGGLIGSQVIGGYMDQQAAKQQQEYALEQWRNNAFPSASAVSSESSLINSQLAEEEVKRRKQLSEQMAKRGMGNRSGLYAQGLSDLQSAGMSSKANALMNLAKFSNTPYSAPPIGTQSYSSAGGRVADLASNYFMLQAMAKMFGGG